MPPPRYVIAARNGVAAVFGLNGLGIASWFARVPAAKDALDLSAGALGLLMLTLSAGAVLALPVAGVVAYRIGAARTVATAGVCMAAGLVLAGAAAGTWGWIPAVGVGLFAIGFGAGCCEVAMNVEAAAVERRLGRTIMPRFHAAWSLGTVAGAGAGAAAARLDVPIGAHLAAMAVIVGGGTVLAVRSFLPDEREREPSGTTGGGQRAAWREPRTVLIGLLVLVMAFTEGTANDWLAVAFVDGHGVSEAVGAASFGVFVAAMTVGRTVGTVALDRWGRLRVLWVTMGFAAVGALVTVYADSLVLALAGVALWGVGACLGFPVGMSAAADEESRAPARVSVVAVMGYTAFLAGPPVVGLLGDRVGVLRALLIVPLLIVPALALVPVVRPPRVPARSPEPVPAATTTD